MNPKTKQIISEAFYREYEWGRKGYLGLWWGDEKVLWGVTVRMVTLMCTEGKIPDAKNLEIAG